MLRVKICVGWEKMWRLMQSAYTMDLYHTHV